jgi:predicted pyridoxine 5'-phosphate oxidase superfamily flavin-nucleotide-binding protein
MARERGWQQTLTPALQAFIAERDSWYLGTATAAGQPYIQHRGGPKGFLKVLDDRTLAFADFRGNKQYITVGALAENDKAFIFLMDYAGRRRIKIWGRARVIEDDPAFMEHLIDPTYKGHPEQAIVLTIEAWDANCPQHITRRYTDEDIATTVQALHDRIAELEAENRALRETGSQSLEKKWHLACLPGPYRTCYCPISTAAIRSPIRSVTSLTGSAAK